MELLLTIAGVILKILKAFLGPVVSYIYSTRKKQVLPPIENDQIYISATDVAEKIRKQELSSEEICKTYINRIKQVNQVLNAVVEERFNEALKDAKNADMFLKNSKPDDVESLRQTKPLFGVPITVKESCSLKGMSLCVGSRSRLGYKAENDGVIVARLKEAGAIPLCVTNTPELCVCWESHNLVTGTTNNPNDTTRTSGGSSGGEGSLLGSGASLIGIGSDLAGSIRLPAMYNGIFGHKPTARIASIKGHSPYCNCPEFPDYLVIGPMTRYAKDLRLLLGVMVEPELKKGLQLQEKVDLSKINVFFMEDAGSAIHLPTVDNEIKLGVRKAVEHLKKKCHSTIKDHKFTELARSTEICGSTLFSIVDIPNLLKWTNSNLFTETLKSLIGRSEVSLNLLVFYILQGLFQKHIGDYRADNETLKKRFIETLGPNGVFIYPTFTEPAHNHHQFFLGITSTMYLMMANSLGIPSTTIPCGLNKKGLPIGIQVMAAPNQDRLCLAVAEELEKTFGGWIPPPSC